ncbi:GNAT family protein [Microbacterium sp. STN6]|uniref:GNAT family N-acetyltransferase n=1 Tax=Microbacterium sp. STN6 TaxID=2995588 RepID=UPI002260F882|nr:GNAT family protein [Microbacterium sp. STN6]MCX7520959.1 GNAT family protein [Microbacterium sp. STN6]
MLRSSRLALSAPTLDDVAAITAECQDEAIQRWTTVPSPYTRADAEGFVREVATPGWEQGTSCTWGIRMGGPLALGASRQAGDAGSAGASSGSRGAGAGSSGAGAGSSGAGAGSPGAEAGSPGAGAGFFESNSVQVGPLVGMIGLDNITDGAAEIGFWLAPGARGLGVMSEAVGLVCSWAFAEPGPGRRLDHAPGLQNGQGLRDGQGLGSGQGLGNGQGLGLRRIEWRAFVGNTASAGVARRAGFRFEGMHRLAGVQRGIRLDDWSAALLATDPRTPVPGWPPFTFARLGSEARGASTSRVERKRRRL